MIDQALIIDAPWIDEILAGRKHWEMRSTATSARGRIGLIRKGSGQIVGVADLVGSVGPLDRAAMLASVDRHRIPAAMITSGEVDRWCYAWELAAVQPLRSPVRYEHPFGAVIWVRIRPEVGAAVAAQLSGTPAAAVTNVAAPAEAFADRSHSPASIELLAEDVVTRVPASATSTVAAVRRSRSDPSPECPIAAAAESYCQRRS